MLNRQQSIKKMLNNFFICKIVEKDKNSIFNWCEDIEKYMNFTGNYTGYISI